MENTTDIKKINAKFDNFAKKNLIRISTYNLWGYFNDNYSNLLTTVGEMRFIGDTRLDSASRGYYNRKVVIDIDDTEIEGEFSVYMPNNRFTNNYTLELDCDALRSLTPKAKIERFSYGYTFLKQVK